MKMTSTARLGMIILVLISIWIIWYLEAGDFRDSAVSGTYTIQLGSIASTLVLRPDHSFQQELVGAGTVTRTRGNWRRVSKLGIICFTKDFQKLPGQEESPDGTTYGYLANWFGVRSITLAPDPDGPTFHKKWFR